MFLSLLVGALFVSSLAFALGVWSNSSRLFEVAYSLLLYVGPINKTVSLDSLGSTPGTWSASIPGVFFTTSIVLLLAAFLGRKLCLVS